MNSHIVEGKKAGAWEVEVMDGNGQWHCQLEGERRGCAGLWGRSVLGRDTSQTRALRSDVPGTREDA